VYKFFAEIDWDIILFIILLKFSWLDFFSKTLLLYSNIRLLAGQFVYRANNLMLLCEIMSNIENNILAPCRHQQSSWSYLDNVIFRLVKGYYYCMHLLCELIVLYFVILSFFSANYFMKWWVLEYFVRCRGRNR
jgi:hypothetical protein